MAFELDRDESVKKGVHRIARKQLKKALEDLRNPSGDTESVHSVRKRLKRLRAICRLVREELGKRRYKKENLRFRDAAKPLTQVRDAEVLCQTLDKLVKESGGRLSDDAVAPIRRGLETNRDAVRRRVIDDEQAKPKVAKMIEQACSNLRKWKIGHNGWSAVSAGLDSGYRKCQQAGADAAAVTNIEHLHEWRKQAKYFWHELQLIAPARPEELEPMADQVHELTDRLGDDHDLAVLEQTLTGNSDTYGGQPVVEKLLPLIGPQRKELQRQAFDIGRRLFCEDADVFICRIHGYWKSWQNRSPKASQSMNAGLCVTR